MKPDERRNNSKSSGRVGFICSVLGCLGWLALIPFLDSCEQGEQLARYFAALFNLILLGIGGGLATLLCLAGLVRSRRSTQRGNCRAGRSGIWVACAGLFTGLLVTFFFLPTALRILS